MKIKHTALSKMVFEHIDELFAEEVGPVAPFLCEEAVDEWIQKVKSMGKGIGVKTIPIYIDILASEIEDPKTRQGFIDKAFEIEVLKPHKP